MDRRAFHRTLLTTAVAAPFAGTGAAAAGERRPSRAVPRRSVVEYGLPLAGQTHEVVRLPGTPLVLVSQMTGSALLKVWLDQATEEVLAVRAFPFGPPESRPHGLAVSSRYPGHVWVTLEGANRLLLVDPGAGGVHVPPEVVRTIDVPGAGPHHVGEYGDHLWVTLKGSNQVLAVDHTDPSRHRLYDALPNPIFVARHPESGEFYVSQDNAGRIMRIDPHGARTAQLEVPPERGATPVGLAAGPGGVWVTLLGTTERGTGTFGRIAADGSTTWFRLQSSEVAGAGLLHIAFGPEGGEPTAWVLGSSIICPTVPDVIVRVTFDPGWTRVVEEEVATLPTQHCKAHRVLPLSKTVLVTELTSSTLAQLATAPGAPWDRPTTPASGDPG